MAVLDDLSGFEFEDVMEDVFRKLGYENVRQAEKVADEGRDVVMEEVVDGTRRGVVVECKHTATVGRPVVQKLHSAIATHDFSGPRRGIAVTTGRFTGPAEEYAERLAANGDPYPIELIDGRDLREIAEEVGLDLKNGRIEVLCNETLRPHDPASAPDAPVREAFREVANLSADDLPDPDSRVTFRPVVAVTADVNAVFETSVGVIHRINERSRFVVHAERGRPKVADPDVAALVADNLAATVPLDGAADDDAFDAVETRRFGQTETEYTDWAVERLREHHTTTVTYTGDNNVTYDRTCEPNRSDVTVRRVEPVYLPELRHVARIGEYEYPFEYAAAGPSRVTTEDGIRRCVHCSTAGESGDYTHCANCGAIACGDHVRTERLIGEPVCTGCAVTERFALSTKYFYDEANRDAFQEEYAAMPLHEKAMENPALVAAAGVGAMLVGLLLLTALGVV